MPVVLYRESESSVIAMEDRCCQRFAPLTKGRLEGDAVRCVYHGLQFAPSGQCIEIPGEGKVPPQMKVQTFPVAERQQLIWVWLGDPALADPSEIVDLPYLDTPEWAYREG